MAEKALQNNSYLESYTTAPEHRLSSRDAGYFFFRGFAQNLQLKILYNLGDGQGVYWRSYGRPGPLPRQGPTRDKFAFYLKALEARGSDQCRRQERREGVTERTNNA